MKKLFYKQWVNMITIITKFTCPFCSATKQFLDSMDIEYIEIEISNDPEEYQRYKDVSGMRTVPQIFNGEAIKENLIGGYDDMMAKYNSGELFLK